LTISVVERLEEVSMAAELETQDGIRWWISGSIAVLIFIILNFVGVPFVASGVSAIIFFVWLYVMLTILPSKIRSSHFGYYVIVFALAMLLLIAVSMALCVHFGYLASPFATYR
jgi:hypothetical protein